MAIWNKACRECGAQQAPLVEKARADLKRARDQAESLLADLDFEAAADALTEAYAMATAQNERLSLLEDSLMFQREQELAEVWHNCFSARLELSKIRELGRLASLLKQAMAQEQAYDYEAGLQTLGQIGPSLRQATFETQLSTTAEEVTERLITKQSRLKKLEGIVRERVKKREFTGLLPLVDELLTLRPDRPDVQKFKAQLERRDILKPALASGDYETALSLDPNNSQALAMKEAGIKETLASGDYEAVRFLVNGLTNLSVGVAETLAKRRGDLCLDSLTSVSVEVAEALAKHEGFLSLGSLTELSEALAQSFCKHEGSIDFYNLTDLSDTAAQYLAKHANLTIQLDNLPASAAKILRDAGHGE
jgi:hypothetical protein